jgi:hypothetical protein
MDNYLALLNHMMQHLDEELATTRSRLEALDPLDILYVIQMRGLDWVRTYTPEDAGRAADGGAGIHGRGRAGPLPQRQHHG